MAKHNTSRADRVRLEGDYDPTAQKANWSGGFGVSDVDSRHSYHAGHVPSWDKTPQAEMARKFANWKDRNPVAYSDINNMTGNAEEWFFDNGGDTSAYDGAGDLPPVFGSGVILLGIGAVMTLTLIPLSWLIIEYAPNSLGWDVHWTIQGLGLLIGLAGMLGMIGLCIGLVLTIIGAPFVLLKLIWTLLSMPFRSAKKKDELKIARAGRKRALEKAQTYRAQMKAEKKAKRRGSRRR